MLEKNTKAINTRKTFWSKEACTTSSQQSNQCNELSRAFVNQKKERHKNIKRVHTTMHKLLPKFCFNFFLKGTG